MTHMCAYFLMRKFHGGSVATTLQRVEC